MYLPQPRSATRTPETSTSSFSFSSATAFFNPAIFAALLGAPGGINGVRSVKLSSGIEHAPRTTHMQPLHRKTRNRRIIYTLHRRSKRCSRSGASLRQRLGGDVRGLPHI